MNDRYQIFISSTYQDLHRQRRLIAEAIQVKGLYAAGMELFPASDKGAWAHIERSIQESDLYLLIAAGRYGSQKPGSDKSYTELEYELALQLAESKGLRLAVLVWDRHNGDEYFKNDSPESGDEFEKQKAFCDRLANDMQGGVSYFFDDATLINRTHAALDEFIRNTGPGWVRADLSPNHEEIVALENKLKTYQHRLEKAEDHIQSLLKVAALPEEEFELGCDLVYQWTRSGQKDIIPDETATVRWEEIFTAIGSVLSCPSAKPRKSLDSTITNLATTKFNKKSSNGWTLTKVKIHTKYMQRVIDHLVRNKWVKPTHRERNGWYYELTPLGREAFLENQTVASVSG